MIKYLNYGKTIFRQGPGNKIRRKEKNLFLLGKNRQGSESQENPYG